MIIINSYYYSRDTSFHGWSPYVPYIWNTHHCNNISIISHMDKKPTQIMYYDEPTIYGHGVI